MTWSFETMKRIEKIAADTMAIFRKELTPPQAALCVAQLMLLVCVESNAAEEAIDAIVVNAKGMLKRFQERRH